MNKFCFKQIILAKCGLWFEGWNGNGGERRLKAKTGNDCINPDRSDCRNPGQKQ